MRRILPVFLLLLIPLTSSPASAPAADYDAWFNKPEWYQGPLAVQADPTFSTQPIIRVSNGWKLADGSVIPLVTVTKKASTRR